MYGYIYMTTNLVNNRKYIGQKKSKTFLGDKYLGSGLILKQAVEFYGRDNFKVEMLCECESKEELDKKEIFFIKQFNAQTDRTFYNICKGGDAGSGGPRFKGHHHSEATKKKMSESRKGASNSNYGNHWTQSDELKKLHSKLSSGSGNGMFGKKHSEKAKEMIGEKNRLSMTGRIRITNGRENKIVKPDELDYYLANGWYKGRTISKK